MHFGLTGEQQQLTELARDVVGALFPRPARDPSDAACSSLGTKLAETGLAGILVPADLGGGGATLVEGAILGEAFGYAGAPGALIGSTLLAAAALELVRASDRPAVAEAILNGEPCAVLVAGDLTWPPRGAGDVAWGWRDGSLTLAPDGGDVLAAGSDGFRAIGTADLGLMLGQPTYEPLAAPSALVSSSRGRRFLAAANVLISSVLLGHMRAAFDGAVEYAKHRVQYGAHIGSFQAVRHMCADMLVDVDSSRSATYGAAWAVSSLADVDECERSAAVAKVWCSEAGLRVCESSLQVHGGIGFTWESTIHDHLRATLVGRASFMTPEQALELVAEADSWI